MPETLSLILSRNHAEIIKAALYFKVFNYPLSVNELYENSAVSLSRDSFFALVNELTENGLLREKDGFVFAGNVSEEDLRRRIAGNKGAEAIMPTAYEYSRKVAAFPFVEGVCLSGALSKNYYDEKGDIDFFIITKPGRLWICRTLLILCYKLLPAGRKKYWCTNYFVSSDDLEIPDLNPFTGTELAYLVPTVNYAVYKKLLNSNSWYKKGFPNKPEAADINCIPESGSFLKRCVESLISGSFGSWLDNRLLSITLRHWRRKYPDLALEDFELQFRSRKNVCKRHTKGFQNKVLKLWKEKQSAFEKEFNVSLG